MYRRNLLLLLAPRAQPVANPRKRILEMLLGRRFRIRSSLFGQNEQLQNARSLPFLNIPQSTNPQSLEKLGQCTTGDQQLLRFDLNQQLLVPFVDDLNGILYPGLGMDVLCSTCASCCSSIRISVVLRSPSFWRVKKKLEKEFSSGILKAVDGETPRKGAFSEQKEGLAVSGV